jgi:hypothetical protein
MEKQVATLFAGAGVIVGLLVIVGIVLVVLAVVKPGLIGGVGGGRMAFGNQKGGCDSCPYAR